MTILGATFLLCWLTILLAPGTATARTLHDLLVRAPAARLSRITRADMAAAIVVAVGIAMIAFVGETDKARTIMFAMPDIAIWITTFELSSVVDVLLAIVVTVSNLRLPAPIARALSGLGRRRTRIRTRRPNAPANDDDRHAGIATTGWPICASSRPRLRAA